MSPGRHLANFLASSSRLFKPRRHCCSLCLPGPCGCSGGPQGRRRTPGGQEMVSVRLGILRLDPARRSAPEPAVSGAAGPFVPSDPRTRASGLSVPSLFGDCSLRPGSRRAAGRGGPAAGPLPSLSLLGYCSLWSSVCAPRPRSPPPRGGAEWQLGRTLLPCPCAAISAP